MTLRKATAYERELHGYCRRGPILNTRELLKKAVRGMILVCAMREWPDGKLRETPIVEGVLDYMYGDDESPAISVLQVGGEHVRRRHVFYLGGALRVYESEDALPWWAVAGGRPDDAEG
jgi:hypothetical protein